MSGEKIIKNLLVFAVERRKSLSSIFYPFPEILVEKEIHLPNLLLHGLQCGFLVSNA